MSKPPPVVLEAIRGCPVCTAGHSGGTGDWPQSTKKPGIETLWDDFRLSLLL